MRGDLEEKYRLERDKRLRADGVSQYLQATDAFLTSDVDPYAGPDVPRQPRYESAQVVIVGGGLCGLLLAVRLQQAGIHDFLIVEKAADFGGTWYWNRYPGLNCDIESYIYLPLLEEVGYIPTQKYVGGAEIFAHVQRIARKFDLYRRAVLRTVVKEMRWIESESRWSVTTDRGDCFRAKYAITAGGLLHKPKLPGIAGIDRFAGRWFHTSRWDYGYTGGNAAGNLTGLSDKKVGIIGTGATAIQCVPPLALSARHLYVFQRTPASVDVRANRPTDPTWSRSLEPGWQQQRMENFNAIANGRAPALDLVDDGWTQTCLKLLRPADPSISSVQAQQLRQQADFGKMDAIRARVDAIVQDPATAASLKPYYNWFCKRPCFHDEYLQTFNRSNVTLVDTKGRGVERITERGVVALGREYQLDCLIFATGFELEFSFEYARRLGFEIYGHGARPLSDKWRNGASTFHGLYTRGFPNYFICSILQVGLSFNITHLLDERARHIAHVIAHCEEHGVRTLETSESAETKWVEEVVSLGEQPRKFFAECTPSYSNNEGSTAATPAAVRNVLYAGGAVSYFELLRQWRSCGNLPGLELGT